MLIDKWNLETHFQALVAHIKSIELLYSLLGVLFKIIVDESVAKAISGLWKCQIRARCQYMYICLCVYISLMNTCTYSVCITVCERDRQRAVASCTAHSNVVYQP